MSPRASKSPWALTPWVSVGPVTSSSTIDELEALLGLTARVYPNPHVGGFSASLPPRELHFDLRPDRTVASVAVMSRAAYLVVVDGIRITHSMARIDAELTQASHAVREVYPGLHTAPSLGLAWATPGKNRVDEAIVVFDKDLFELAYGQRDAVRRPLWPTGSP